jgi:hypothetical protein
VSAFKILGRLVSKADQALDTIKREKGTGAEFLRELEKTPGVKQAELKERGIDKALQSKPKMTKAEVKKVLEENPPPKLKEQVHGGNEYQEALDSKAKEIVGDRNATFDDLYGRDREMAREAVESELGFNPETQYEKYRTPGGENYREILLKLPKRGLNDREQEILMTYESNIRRGDVLDPFHQKQYENLLAKKEAGSQDYFSPHFEGEPNVLAHIRVQDFKTPEGKKVLLVDEIQSDWHQEGRKKGYKTAESLENWYNQNKLENDPPFADLNPDQINVLERNRGAGMGSDNSVPDAPFKKNWHELAMKRVLDYAADKGYDTVAITPGKTQAERYDLSKHIDDVTYDPDNKRFVARKDGYKVMERTQVEPEDLPDLVGKDVAEKLVTVPRDSWGVQFLSGIDLQVGGEGMKGFYDQILPTYLNNLGKQYGAQVETYNLPRPPQDSTLTFGYPGAEEYVGGRITWGDFLSRNPRAAEEFFTPVHKFDIPPQMREKIKAKGLPLYGKIALPEAGTLAAGSGAATIGIGAPEQPLPPQMYAQPEYRRGGQVKRKVKFTNNPDTMRLELMSGKR